MERNAKQWSWIGIGRTVRMGLLVGMLAVPSVADATAAGPRTQEQRADSPALRMASETLAGGAFYFVGLFGGALTGLGLCGGEWSCAEEVAFGAFVGGATLLPLGVYGIGSAYAGSGSYLASLTGGVLGIATTIGLMLAVRQSQDLGTGAGLLVFFGPPVLGAVIGYEVSHRADDQTGRSGASRLRPMARVLPRAEGALLGVDGAF